MTPRPPARIALAVCAALVLSLFAPSTAWAGSLMTFGAAVKPRSGQTKIKAVQALETEIGRKLHVVRVYDLWNSPFPDSYTSWLTTPAGFDVTKPGTQGGRTLVLSIKATKLDGTKVPWSSIASAQPGSAVHDQIVSWANEIKSFGQPIYLSFNHEPEAAASSTLGTPADYIGAWNRIRQVFAAQGVTNATWIWIGTAFGFTSNRNFKATRYYPLAPDGSDTAVDVIGVDGYNWYTCRPDAQLAWKSASSVFGGFYTWVTTNHPTKPVIITEFGSVEDPADPNRKASWISDAAAWFKSWNQVVGALYWSSHAAAKYPNCVFYVDTSTTSANAFAAMGADPSYRG